MMRAFFNEFTEYCKTPGVEDSNKAKSYSKAIEYLCDYLKITKIDSQAVEKIKSIEGNISDKNSAFYKELLAFLTERKQKSYLDNGFVRAALKPFFEFATKNVLDMKDKFRKWFAEQPQRNNPLVKYKDETIDAAIRLLERGMSKLEISKYTNLNCFDVTDYSEFKIIRDECYAYAEKFDKGQNHSDFRNGLDYYLQFLKEACAQHNADSKIGTFDSWEIVDEVTAIKTCDKSFFDYNGSGVPKGICWFFGAEDIEPGENKSVTLIYNGIEYNGKLTNDTTDRRRIQIRWYNDLCNCLGKYKGAEIKAKFTKNTDSIYEITIMGGEKEMTIKEKINAIKEYIAAKGFNYEGDLIENFYLSLKSKPFVILAGTSGTGKTRLVKLFAEAIGAKMKLVPVRPDWSDSSDLFGHTDLSGNFQPGAIIDFIKQAEWDSSTPHFLCLDEMNLARVEYYLSDFLSVIETRDRKANGEIETDPLVDVDYYKDENAKVKYGRVFIPENLYIVGTVNMDETTFPFSKKVLDRANTIEFSYVNLMSKVNDKEETAAQKLDNSFLKTEYLYLRDCDDNELIENICFDLEELNQILVRANLHVGYRVRDEISFYLMNNKKADLLSKDSAFDNEIMQKILPRVQGSSAAIKDVLSELFIKCAGDYTGFSGISAYEQMESYIDSKECKYPNSAKKIKFMMRRYEEDGFTSYWL